MGIKKDDFKKFMNDLADTIRQETSSINEFFAEIVKDNDWSFVIKAHALIETIINKLLIKKIGELAETRSFTTIPLSKKIDMLHEIGICSKNDKQFLKYISALRNKLVHNSDNLKFTFDEYFKKMSQNQEKEFFRILGVDKSEENMMIEHPKEKLWMLLWPILSSLMINGEKDIFHKRLEELNKQTNEDLIKDYLPEIFLSDYSELFDDL